MKKRLVFVLIAACLFTMNSVAVASTVSVGDRVILKLTPGVGGANDGGSFDVNILGSSEILFSTFCLERNEYFSPGIPYYVGSISDSAMNGGYGGAIQNKDVISEQTAYLYYQWATGAINHTYVNARDLQLAIWSLEDEMVKYPIALTSGAHAFITSAANASGLYGVQVMNLYGSYNSETGYECPKQSQLIYNPVPEPATLLLLCVGLIGLGLKKKSGR